MARVAQAANAVDSLHEFARNRGPRGFTYADIEEAFGWERNYFFCVVRRLRLRLADGPMQLICTPQGPKELWRYVYCARCDDTVLWQINRLDDEISRNDTQAAVDSSVAKALDENTAEGMLARFICEQRQNLGVMLGRLREMIARGGGAPGGTSPAPASPSPVAPGGAGNAQAATGTT